MSAFIDFEEKSVDKAVEKACKALNVTKERLKYDIISYGSSGIFGIVGTKKALIRVTPPPESIDEGKPSRPGKTRKPAEKKHRKPSEKSRPAAEGQTPPPHESSPAEEGGDISALVDEAFGEGPSFADGAAAQADAGKPDDEGEDALSDQEDGAVQEAMQAEDGDDGPFQEKEEGRPKEAAPTAGPAEYKAAAAWVHEFLAQAVRLISPDSEIRMEADDSAIRFKIEGGDAARMIGKRGQTLDTIQYLAEKAVSKQFGQGIAVEIDVDDYLDKRRTELKQLANRLAQKAAQTGKPMVINRINVNDRRIVHLELKENTEIRTQSTGNGDLRKLLILPKKKAGGKKPATKGRKPGNGRRRPDSRSRKPENDGQKAETSEQGMENNNQ
ncbi:MAG: RNA-binding cell elongation regulator Jag/EloR [Desulfosalsimonadaceae bacterium]